MIPTQKDQKSTRRRRHEQQPAISKHIFPNLPRPILLSDFVDFSVGAPVENTKIQITARVISRIVAIRRIRIETAMDNEICEREEETGDPAWMWSELFAFEECIEYESGVGEGTGGSDVGGRDGAGVRAARLA